MSFLNDFYSQDSFCRETINEPFYFKLCEIIEMMRLAQNKITVGRYVSHFFPEIAVI